MNFGNIKAFLKELPIKSMNGQQKFLAVATFCSDGKANQEITINQILANWNKSILQIPYHPVPYSRAQGEGWINPVIGKKGVFVITEDGIEFITNLSSKTVLNSGEIKQAGALIVVNKKGTHSFDKLLRQLFSGTQKEIFIADSYVDETIFDNLLDSIPKKSAIKLLYMKDSQGFGSRVKRFKVQYQNFYIKKYNALHDRFVIIDNIGYIIGPSLKDAALNSPALVVKLAGKETNLLKSFFNDLWKISK